MKPSKRVYIGFFVTIAGLAVVSATREDIKQSIRDFHVDAQSNQLREDKTYFPDDIVALMPKITEYFTSNKQYKPKPTTAFNLACDFCVIGMDILFGLLVEGEPLPNILETVYKGCSLAMDKNVCSGVIKNYGPQINYLSHNAKNMTGSLFCALSMGGKCGDWNALWNWDIDVGSHPGDVKPPYQPPTAPSPSAKKGKVLQVSDFHIDMSYLEGTVTDCGLPLCCMNFTQMSNDAKTTAGYWGDYSCDLPYRTADDMLRHIAEEHADLDFEYVMVTGDYPAHDVWLQSKEYNLNTARLVIDMVNKYFPGKKIIPSLGNHDSFPCNNFPPASITDPEFSEGWNYKALAEFYGDWLPDDARDSFEKYGSYHYELFPGFRVIIVNSNGYLGYNFWMNLDFKDPFGLIPWMYNILLKSEANNEKVHIISHAPPGDHSAISGWGQNWAKIVDRFANTITGQFYGHTHNDQFILFYDIETNSIPINVGYVSPSATTYTGLNPSYRIYTIDGPYEGASMEIIDIDTYIFNLTAANDAGRDKPQYFHLYNHRQDLVMTNLYPSDFDDLVHRLVSNNTLYNQFYRYFNSDSVGDVFDRNTVICTMLQTAYFDIRKCKELLGDNLDY